jgi:hypothetical protein
MIPTITICLLAMRGRERLTYIKDHAQICVLLVTITIYAICYTTYDVPYIADSIDVVDAHALVVYSVERVRDVSVDVDVLHVGIDARSYYYMVVLDKQYNAHVFMDWLDKRNSLYSVETNVILGRNICASHMSMRHRIVNMVTVIIIWELVKRRTLVRIP